MAKADFQVVGISAPHRMRVAASVTRGYYGEPVIWTGTLTSGVASDNTVVVATDNTSVIATDSFVGVLNKDMVVNSAGTVLAHATVVSRPIPNATKIRGKLKTASTGDTESEIIGLLFDIYAIDLTTSTYTWAPAAADTHGFTVIDGNPTRSTVDCIVDARVLRADIS